MKLTKSKLKQLIKEEIEAMDAPAEKEFQSVSALLGKALRDLVGETELKNDPDVVEAVEDHDYSTDYEDWDRRSVLVLGTIKMGGGDALYTAIEKAGLLDDLLKKMESYVEQHAKPVKRPRKLGIIPYSDYQWNEDKWGEEL
jgi:hypothetical protein